MKLSNDSRLHKTGGRAMKCGVRACAGGKTMSGEITFGHGGNGEGVSRWEFNSPAGGHQVVPNWP